MRMHAGETEGSRLSGGAVPFGLTQATVTVPFSFVSSQGVVLSGVPRCIITPSLPGRGRFRSGCREHAVAFLQRTNQLAAVSLFSFRNPNWHLSAMTACP